MAIRSGLFDSTEVVEEISGFPRGDKAQTADFFAAYFSSFISNGIYITPATSFQVLPQSGLTVRVRPGRCFINGYFAIDDEAEDKTFPQDSAAHEYWLVLRLDLADGSIKKVWITDPSPGALPVRNAVIYDLAVARVSVGAGVSTITDGMITDLRADPAYCGRVKSLVDGIGQNVEYADVAGNLAESALAELLKCSGGEMAGPLTLHGNPTEALHAAPKQYVDSRAPQLTELRRYTTSGSFKPADYPSAGNRYVVMLLGAGGGGFYRSSDGTYDRSGGAGAMQYAEIVVPPERLNTSITVTIGAAAVASDGGDTQFGEYIAPGGKKAPTTNSYGAGGSTGAYTGESGILTRGGNSWYGNGATESSGATGHGAGGWKQRPGSNGLVIVYGYR
jgi:hypothetical protein